MPRRLKEAFLGRRPPGITAQGAAEIIEGFLEDRCTPHDWDDFLFAPLRNQQLDRVRRLCVDVSEMCPPERRGRYCSEEGRRLLRKVAADLRRGLDLDGEPVREDEA